MPRETYEGLWSMGVGPEACDREDDNTRCLWPKPRVLYTMIVRHCNAALWVSPNACLTARWRPAYDLQRRYPVFITAVEER
ncbi:hypothetical protein J6590_009108 [Homalodisca vitripennis]|nr:hypothetical protein J6590_009108 [Homalodisca vitripennis]